MLERNVCNSPASCIPRLTLDAHTYSRERTRYYRNTSSPGTRQAPLANRLRLPLSSNKVRAAGVEDVAEDVVEAADEGVGAAVVAMEERTAAPHAREHGRTRTRQAGGTTTASEAMTRRWQGWQRPPAEMNTRNCLITYVTTINYTYAGC